MNIADFPFSCGYLATVSAMSPSTLSISFSPSSARPMALLFIWMISRHGVAQAASGYATTGAMSLSVS